MPSSSAVPIFGRETQWQNKTPKVGKEAKRRWGDWQAGPVELPCPSVGQWGSTVSSYSFTTCLFHVQSCAESFELETHCKPGLAWYLPLWVAALSVLSPSLFGHRRHASATSTCQDQLCLLKEENELTILFLQTPGSCLPLLPWILWLSYSSTNPSKPLSTLSPNFLPRH